MGRIGTGWGRLAACPARFEPRSPEGINGTLLLESVGQATHRRALGCTRDARFRVGENALNQFWHLHNVDWLGELSERDLEGLRRRSDAHDYDRGATVFTPTSHPHSLYLLEHGLVRIYRLSSDGDETTFGYVAPGEVFGELTAFGDFPRESFAMAVNPSRVWKIPREIFQDLLTGRPSLVFEITRQIGQRMKRIESRVEDLVFRDVRTRVARILNELAKDFGVPRGEQLLLDLELTQAELATLVGSTRQTVNASLRDLEKDGLIQRDGRRLIVVKPQELARQAPDRSESD